MEEEYEVQINAEDVEDNKKDCKSEKGDLSSEEEDALRSLLKEAINDDRINIDIPPMRLFYFHVLSKSLTQLDCTDVISLSVRRNLLHQLSPFPFNIKRTLTELDLFDNKLLHLGHINHMPHLQKLDLSYNQITSIPSDALQDLPSLQELYLIENQISNTEGLVHLSRLRLLELGGNRLRHIPHEISSLHDLEELHLGKNKIHTIEGLEDATRLRVLSLPANRIKHVGEGLRQNLSLREIYLSENCIAHIEGCDHLPFLRLVDYSRNPIESLNGVEGLSRDTMEEFWLSEGKLELWDELRKLSSHEKLHTVYFLGNPLERNDVRYRAKVTHLLPQLRFVDSWPIASRATGGSVYK